MSEFLVKLLAIFQNVNDWLRFAEAKNAALLAFSGTGMTATLTVLATVQSLPVFLRFGLLMSTALLCVCTLLCALSFIPKTNLEKLLWLRSQPAKKIHSSPADNLYYFGDLRKYSSGELLNAINVYYFDGKIIQPYSKECCDIAAQITINSDIASLKFQTFTYAIYFLIASILSVPFLFLMLTLLVILRSL
jgi:hypothetical protein